MQPPILSMQAISAQQQHTLMQRLLMGSSNGGQSMATSRNGGGGIEDIAARLHRQNGNGSSNGYYHLDISQTTWGGDQLSISNNTPLMHLTCLECGINKNNSEDMEVHLKMEHLNWQPFQCPICLSERASDAQMREHLHSAHRKNMNKFIYVDNVNAKRSLQIMMDRALSHAMSRRSSGHPHANGSRMNAPLISPANQTVNHSTPTVKSDRNNEMPSIIDRSSPTELGGGVTVTAVPRKRHHEETGNTNTDALLASISRAASNGVIEGEVLDDVEPLPMFSTKRIKSEFDIDDNEDSGGGLEDNVLDNLNPISVLDNVAALFSTDGRIEDTYVDNHIEKGVKQLSAKALSSAISKKRVLGECSKCMKPVTAGARQMHMFFHLAKDHGTYRFRCLFEGCSVEHYRKDQMENHQSKIHGKIDPDMMEDRSLELFHRCQELNHELFVANRLNAIHNPHNQELSMELLGTKSGSTPGPTAAKAEVAYQAHLAAQKEKDKIKINSSNSKTTAVTRSIPDEEHPLECRLCHKTMQNRIRGFHILWHMAKDMGINRYICRICKFGHDRSQSVQVHGKKEHGTDDVVEDRIGEYSEEVKQMSESCFGFQALFAQDNKRRSKIPMAPTRRTSKKCDDDETADLSLDPGADAQGESLDGLEDRDISPEEEHEDEQDVDEEEVEEERDSTYSFKPKKRHSGRFPRFGLRRPQSKSKRTEMAKLREISMLLGGAQYFKKKVSEAAHCEKCGKVTNSRMSEHAYTHIDVHLFLCPRCDTVRDTGHQCRDIVVRHIKEFHNCNERPIDNRLKHAQNIKDMIKECYPAYFIDAPIPTMQDIEKLKLHMGADAMSIIAGLDETDDEHVQDEDEDGEEKMEETEGDDDSLSEQKLVMDELDEGDGGLELEQDEEFGIDS
uniref:C2H2-type domain-containing protein n=1 Tax=Heterorhabditis bacteriophora TaxID=37862 RepID=A0A1I7XUG1_HETBA